MSNQGALSQPPGGGTPLNILGDLFTCKVVGKDTENDWALFEAVVLPGSIVPAHRHDGFDEAFYILEGELEMCVEGESVIATKGYFINIGRGTVHGYQNKGMDPVRYLSWTHPAGIEHFYGEIDARIKTLPDDLERIVEIAEHHHIEILPPAEG